MSYPNQSSVDAHSNGDCWPSQCPICAIEDALEMGEDE